MDVAYLFSVTMSTALRVDFDRSFGGGNCGRRLPTIAENRRMLDLVGLHESDALETLAMVADCKRKLEEAERDLGRGDPKREVEREDLEPEETADRYFKRPFLLHRPMLEALIAPHLEMLEEKMIELERGLEETRREKQKILEEIRREERCRFEDLRQLEELRTFQERSGQHSLRIDNKEYDKKFVAARLLQVMRDLDGRIISDFSLDSETFQGLLHRSRQFLHQLLLEILLGKLFRCVVFTAAVILCLFEYLMGYIERGGWASYSVTTWEFRATYTPIELRLAAYFWFKFRGAAETVGQKRRPSELMGEPTISFKKGKYVPRLKAWLESEGKKVDVSLGTYEAEEKATTVYWIGAHYYDERSRFTDKIRSLIRRMNLPACPPNRDFYGKAQWIREGGYLQFKKYAADVESILFEGSDEAGVPNPGQCFNNQEISGDDYSDGSAAVETTEGAVCRWEGQSALHQQRSGGLEPSNGIGVEGVGGGPASGAELGIVSTSAVQPQSATCVEVDDITPVGSFFELGCKITLKRGGEEVIVVRKRNKSSQIVNVGL